jgi:hypothetical protein
VSAFADWMQHFRALHERARRGELNAGEELTYQASRDELARAMLAAQRLSLKPGQTARHQLRVAKALQLDLEIGGRYQRTVTLDLSAGGFSSVLAMPPGVGESMGVTLRLPGTGPLACRARVTDVKPQDGSARIAAAFISLPAADLERLERFVIDAVLAMLPG